MTLLDNLENIQKQTAEYSTSNPQAVATFAHAGDGFSVRSNRNSIAHTQNHFAAMRKASFFSSGCAASVLRFRNDR